MMKGKFALCWLLLFSSLPGGLFAAIKLPALVGDNMVLQRNIAIPIWGWASPGAAIDIAFNGKTYHTVTGNEGKWMLRLNKQKAGGPYEMRVSGDGSLVVLHKILIGDVWICSGQS